MIELTRGDILAADAEALVNTVNCVGVMGRGVALQFRKAYPENFAAYEAACRRGDVVPGRMFVHRVARLGNPRHIINFPTKQHWRGDSRIEFIEAGLDALVEEVRRLEIQSIAVPPLGCGLGGLRWSEVRPRIEKAFASLPEVRVLLYEPAGAPESAKMVRSRSRPQLTLSRAVLLRLIYQYQAALLDPFVTLLEIHKLMYLMQAAGQSLELRYKKGHYGPYAENLRHLLTNLEGHYITGYGDAADAPRRQIELVEGAARQADEFLAAHAQTRERSERVAAVIEGFETPYGMELLTTVHWVALQEGAAAHEAVQQQVYAWNARKMMFPAHHLSLALDLLRERGWLGA